MPAFTYADLTDRRTGSTNPDAFAGILAENIAAEVNLATAVRAGIDSSVVDLRYIEVRGWYADTAKTRADISDDERSEIVVDQTRYLMQLVASMREARAVAAEQIEAEDAQSE